MLGGSFIFGGNGNLAVDTQPPIRDGRRGLYLKDRLYIGYQERARAIDAISYNEQAQRFEFQVVKDDGLGLTPRVYYANRQVCTSCHQGHTPIFANAPWDETNVNGDVIERLQAVRSSFYGMSTTPALNAANDVDRSVNRATLLPASYRIWSDGCGGELLDRDTAGCRAGMFIAMLQYRLSDSTDFDRRSPEFRNFIDVQTRQWRMRWPGGLLIPAANIPDRNPFETRHTVSAKFDPLIRRLPEAQRPKTTMPPLLPVQPDHAGRYSDEAWRNSPDLAALTRFAVAALGIEGSERQRFKRLLDQGYTNLPECTLPAASGGSATALEPKVIKDRLLTRAVETLQHVDRVNAELLHRVAAFHNE